MRRSRVRFTIRGMMVAVAIFGLLMGGGLGAFELWMRWLWVHGMAESCRGMEAELRQAVMEMRDVRGCLGSSATEPPPTPTRLAQMLASAEHCAQLGRKYRRAESRPWELVLSDPRGWER
jgi:hypothetical protein